MCRIASARANKMRDLVGRPWPDCWDVDSGPCNHLGPEVQHIFSQIDMERLPSYCA